MSSPAVKEAVNAMSAMSTYFDSVTDTSIETLNIEIGRPRELAHRNKLFGDISAHQEVFLTPLTFRLQQAIVALPLTKEINLRAIVSKFKNSSPKINLKANSSMLYPKSYSPAQVIEQLGLRLTEIAASVDPALPEQLYLAHHKVEYKNCETPVIARSARQAAQLIRLIVSPFGAEDGSDVPLKLT